MYQNVVVLKADLTIYSWGGHLRIENAVYILLYFLIVFLFYILKDTPLCEAAKNGHTDIVRLLIENGADVNEGERVRLKDKLYML